MKLGRIAIDGTSGAGKSTLGEHLARQLAYLYIDTGAMYRALTWLALSENVDIHNAQALTHLARCAEIEINRPPLDDGRQYTVVVNGYDITWDIRTSQVTQSVASVSRHPEVRKLLINQQRAMAQRGGVVMVGRDIGTVVLPDADLKIFLDACPEVRAYRRYLELVKQRGEQGSATSSMEEVLKDMMRRDEIDRANMQLAKDGYIIMTDHISAMQVVEIVCQKLKDLEILEVTSVCPMALNTSEKLGV